MNFGREELFELGRRSPYRRYISFPVEITEPIMLLPEKEENVPTQIQDMSFWFTGFYNPLPDPKKDEPEEPTKCTCDIQALAAGGCTCGFIEVERRKRKEEEENE